MKHPTHSLGRRDVLKKGGLVATTLAVGVPAASGTAAAQEIPTMVVDVPPVLSADQRGQVVAAIYPGGNIDPAEVLDHEDFDGFKLGPFGSDVDNEGADSVSWRLLPTGNLGVFFDVSTATTWFTPGASDAKLSAPGIAWGRDDVAVR